MWSEERIQEVIRRQNTFFRSGKTLDTAKISAGRKQRDISVTSARSFLRSTK